MPPDRTLVPPVSVTGLAALAALTVALACGGDGPTGPPEPTPEPTTLAIDAGDGQVGVVATALTTSPSVVVLDQFGDPMSGITVTWSPGAGTVSSATTPTGADGVATTTWTLGPTAGAQTLAAAAAGLTGVSFDATAEAGPVSAVSVAPDTMRFASLLATGTVTATAEDEHGNVAADPATWTSRDGSVATVDANGEVTAEGDGGTWVVAEAGGVADSVRVEVAQAAAAITVGPAADTINAIGGTVSLSATVLDAGGSPVDGVVVAYTSLSPAVVTVDGSGTATSASTGTASIVASFDALADTAQIVSRQVPETLSVVPDAEIGLDYGDTLTIVVSAQDSNGVAIPASEATIGTDDPSVASVAGAVLTAGSADGTTDLTVTLDPLQVTTEVTVSGAGFAREWRGGQAGEEAAWSSPYNWWPAGPPGPADTVEVAPTANAPVLLAADTVGSLDVLSGATLDLGGLTLRLTNDVNAAGAIVNGTLEMVGTAASACGTVPDLLLVAASSGGATPVVSLTCDLTVNGGLRSLGGRINDTGHTLKVQP
jgi:hypothetical protein